jgi:DNA adenine methylase
MKWTGAKTKQLPELLEHLRPLRRSTTFFDVFGGSGVVSVAWWHKYALPDAIPEKSAMYSDVLPVIPIIMGALSSDAKEVRRQVESLFTPGNNEANAYYTLREELNERLAGSKAQSARTAALLIYVSRHCFNGLSRFRKDGGFNSPFGKYDAPGIPIDALEAYTRAAFCISAKCMDFQAAMKLAGAGDVIYADPPFVPLSTTSNFTGYAGSKFGPEFQQALVTAAIDAKSRGARVVVSNNDTPEVREMYASATEIHSVWVRRSISRNVDTRGNVGEVVAVWQPKG